MISNEFVVIFWNKGNTNQISLKSFYQCYFVVRLLAVYYLHLSYNELQVAYTMLAVLTKYVFDFFKPSLDHETRTSELHALEKEHSRKSSTSLEEDEEKEELLRNRTDIATKYETKSEQNQEKQAKQVIPGLGVYSDSESSSSES